MRVRSRLRRWYSRVPIGPPDGGEVVQRAVPDASRDDDLEPGLLNRVGHEGTQELLELGALFVVEGGCRHPPLEEHESRVVPGLVGEPEVLDAPPLLGRDRAHHGALGVQAEPLADAVRVEGTALEGVEEPLEHELVELVQSERVALNAPSERVQHGREGEEQRGGPGRPSLGVGRSTVFGEQRAQ